MIRESAWCTEEKATRIAKAIPAQYPVDTVAGVVFSTFRFDNFHFADRSLCYTAEAIPMEWLVSLSQLAGTSTVEGVYTEWRQ